jgi:hypothetical protein
MVLVFQGSTMAASTSRISTPNRLLSVLIGRASAGNPTDDGYRLSFASSERDILPAIATYINAERHWYPLLRFALTVPADGGQIELEVTGPPGPRRFFDALITQ